MSQCLRANGSGCEIYWWSPPLSYNPLYCQCLEKKSQIHSTHTHTHTNTHTKEFVDMKYSLSWKARTELSRQTNPKSRNLWLRKIIKDTQVINQWLKQFTRSIYEVVVIAWSRVQYGKYLPYFAKIRIAKYEKRGKYLSILNQATCHSYIIVKCLLKLNVARVILLTYKLHRLCLM